MQAFGVTHLGAKKGFYGDRAVNIYEGKYNGGNYHFIELNKSRLQAEFVLPDQLKLADHLAGYDQLLVQGRLSDPKTIPTVIAKMLELQKAGKPVLDQYVKTHPRAAFISDASNYPFNEGHFAIRDGEILPLPPESDKIKGKHYVLSTAGGKVSFPLIDTNDPESVRSAGSAFFVPKIVHEGKPVGLLEEVPGTGVVSIANFRGHIGQIFLDNAYSEMNSQKRVDIHTKLMDYLRDPSRNLANLQMIIKGLPVNFDKYGPISLPQNVFTHTYWLESDSASLYCFKTYPSSDGKSAGVTFSQGPDLLFEIANVYRFDLQNAYVGTNGKDVRVILNNNGTPEPIRSTETKITSPSRILGDGKYFDRPIGNFIAFSEV